MSINLLPQDEHAQAHSMPGEYNFIHTSSGKNDECYTHRYAVEPLLEFLEPFRDKIIWCPFDTEKSEFVKVLQENNFKVVFSHISKVKIY